MEQSNNTLTSGKLVSRSKWCCHCNKGVNVRKSQMFYKGKKKENIAKHGKGYVYNGLECIYCNKTF